MQRIVSPFFQSPKGANKDVASSFSMTRIGMQRYPAIMLAIFVVCSVVLAMVQETFADSSGRVDEPVTTMVAHDLRLQGQNSAMSMPSSSTSSFTDSDMEMTRAVPMMKMMVENNDVREASGVDMGVSNSGQMVAEKWNEVMKELETQTNQMGDVKRMLVYEGQASIEVWQGKLSQVLSAIQNIVRSSQAEKMTSYIEEESSYQFTNYNYSPNDYVYDNYGTVRPIKGNGQPQQLKGVNLRIRVASDVFESTMKQVRKAVSDNNDNDESSIVNWRVSSRDVTDSYIDATSRASVVDASRQALQTLLVKAQSVQDIFAIEQELTRLTEQYESHKQRAQALAKDAALSTIYLDIREKIKATITTTTTTPPGPWAFFHRLAPGREAKRAAGKVIQLFAATMNWIVFMVVFWVPILLVFQVLLWVCLPMFQKLGRAVAEKLPTTTQDGSSSCYASIYQDHATSA